MLTMLFGFTLQTSAASVNLQGYCPAGLNIEAVLSRCGCSDPSAVLNLCQNNGSCQDLQELLKQCGCSDESCNSIISVLNGCGFSLTESPAPNGGSSTPTPQPTAPVSDPEKPQTPPVPAQPAPAEPSESESGYALNEYEKEVVRLVNDIRSSYGLGTLSINTELSRVARIKAQDMRERGYFDHNSPTYGTPFEMMKSFGITYRTAGENIAMGYQTPQAVVNGWMNSEGHRRNILNASFTEIGMGYIEQGHYWSQMFIG